MGKVRPWQGALPAIGCLLLAGMACASVEPTPPKAATASQAAAPPAAPAASTAATTTPPTQLDVTKTFAEACAERAERDGPCAVLDAFAAAGTIAETPLRGRRYLGIGWVRHPGRGIEQQLVVVEYRYASNFHEQVHYPNYICALFVRAERDEERRQVESALEEIARGRQPNDNPAYRWGTSYELPNDEHCSAAQRRSDGALEAPDARWVLRSGAGDALVFLAAQWQDEVGEELVFTATPLAAAP